MALQHCPLDDSELPMKLDYLKEIEDHVLTSGCPHHSSGLKHFIFAGCGSRAGTTPLILACQQGKLDSVKYLVETWGVNVCTPATYYSYPTRNSMSVKATPLFVAAFHGYNSIVRYLLERGAQVSVKTSNANGYSELNGLTPLYGAVSNWHSDSRRPLHEQQEERSDVVRSLLEFGADPNADCYRPYDGRPMWLQVMCGIGAVTALIHYGLDFNRPQTREPLLHHLARLPCGFTVENSLSVIKLLIGKGANLLARNVEGFTPLLTSAIKMYDGDFCLNLAVFDFLLEREEYGRLEKIEAMELAGATILSESQNAPHFPKAFAYWRRAHQLRQMEIEVSGSSAEKILGRKIGSHVEWTTLDELDQLELHPENYGIQGLLVKLRILSRFVGNGGHHFLSSQYIDYLSDSSSLEYEEKFSRILDIIWGKFDQFIHRSDLFPPEDVVLMLKLLRVDVDQLISTLSSLEENHPALLNYEKLKISLDLILLATDSIHRTVIKEEDEDHYLHYEALLRIHKTRFNQSLFNLLEMIFRLTEQPNAHKMDRLKQSLLQLEPHRLGNLLLIACLKLSDSKYSALVRFLLEAGADPDVAVDDAGNSSLHVAARLNDPVLSETIATLLLEKGAHVDRVNKAGQTATDVWIETRIENGAETGWSARPEWCRTALKLLCLASRSIQVHKIPYKDTSPATLHSDVEMH